MKVALPDKFEFKSENNKYTLIYEPKKDIIVKHPKGKWVWKSVQAEYPSEVLIAPDANVAYFLGSYGDAGVGLGRVVIYNLTSGEVIRQLELSEVIPNLEELSRGYRDMSNFPWITATKLKDGGKKLEIKVCDKVVVEVDSVKKSASIAH